MPRTTSKNPSQKQQPQLSFEALHNRWIAEGRRKARVWGASYVPVNYITPLRIVKDDLRVAFQDDPVIVDSVLSFYDRYANPVTVASDLWHWFGRDAKEALAAREYLTVPNTLLDAPSMSIMSGAGDVLLQIPTKESLKGPDHAQLALEALSAKRERTARMKQNAENGLAKIDKQITEIKDLIAS